MACTFLLTLGKVANFSVLYLSSMKTIQLLCAKCNGTMTVDSNREVFICPYCGSSVLSVDSDNVKATKIKYDTIKEIEMGSQKLQREIEFEKQKLKKYKVASENKPFIIYMGFSFLMLFVIFLFVYLIPTIKGEIKAPSTSTVYVNQNYMSVSLQFQDAGFENVETIPLGDLSNAFLRNREGDVGKIKEISINGITEFDSG